MLTFIAGALFGYLIAYIYTRKIQKKLNETLQAYLLLCEISTQQLEEYWNFRKEYEAYRARFDPIDTTREGNIVTIKRGANK